MKNSLIVKFSRFILMIVIVMLVSGNMKATVYTLDLALSGQSEVPPKASNATGILIGTYDDATNSLSFNIMFSGLTGPTLAAHFHGPANESQNAGVQIPLAGFPVGVTSGTYSNNFILTPEQETQLLCGLWYVNIHTEAFPGGEIRSQVKEGMTVGSISTYMVALVGSKEFPPVGSPATGTLTGTYDMTTKILSFTVKFNGLTGLTTAAHFHGPAGPGVNGPVVIPLAGFPAGVTSGVYSNSFVLTPLQETQLLGGLWYVNIHNTVFPAGEIRGQMTEGTLTGDCTVPEVPVAQWALLIGFLLIGTYMFITFRSRS